MNNGYRVVREDTYEEDRYDKEEGFKYSVNLEDYTSNMNDVRWNHQQIIVKRAIMGICGDSYWD